MTWRIADRKGTDVPDTPGSRSGIAYLYNWYAISLLTLLPHQIPSKQDLSIVDILCPQEEQPYLLEIRGTIDVQNHNSI